MPDQASPTQIILAIVALIVIAAGVVYFAVIRRPAPRQERQPTSTTGKAPATTGAEAEPGRAPGEGPAPTAKSGAAPSSP